MLKHDLVCQVFHVSYICYSMYKIKLSEPYEESWEKVQVRGGKELDVRVVAHTSVYHSYSNSILVYGGVVASVARYFFKL